MDYFCDPFLSKQVACAASSEGINSDLTITPPAVLPLPFWRCLNHWRLFVQVTRQFLIFTSSFYQVCSGSQGDGVRIKFCCSWCCNLCLLSAEAFGRPLNS